MKTAPPWGQTGRDEPFLPPPPEPIGPPPYWDDDRTLEFVAEHLERVGQCKLPRLDENPGHYVVWATFLNRNRVTRAEAEAASLELVVLPKPDPGEHLRTLIDLVAAIRRDRAAEAEAERRRVNAAYKAAEAARTDARWEAIGEPERLRRLEEARGLFPGWGGRSADPAQVLEFYLRMARAQLSAEIREGLISDPLAEARADA